MLGMNKKKEMKSDSLDLEIPTGKLKDLGLDDQVKSGSDIPGGLDLEDLIQKLEEVGNDYLAEMDPDLKFSSKLIKAHSQALAMVLKKYIPTERGPEFYLASLTGVMAVDLYAKMQRIAAKKKKEAEKAAKEAAAKTDAANGGK